MANIINSRIILRNDALSAWNQSQKKLLKGEMALALHTEEGAYKNKYEIRIGEGDKTFSQLAPTNLVIPYDAISGVTAAAEYALSVSNDRYSACLTKDGEQAGSVFSIEFLIGWFNSLQRNYDEQIGVLSNSLTSLSSE